MVLIFQSQGDCRFLHWIFHKNSTKYSRQLFLINFRLIDFAQLRSWVERVFHLNGFQLSLLMIVGQIFILLKFFKAQYFLFFFVSLSPQIIQLDFNSRTLSNSFISGLQNAIRCCEGLDMLFISEIFSAALTRFTGVVPTCKIEIL